MFALLAAVALGAAEALDLRVEAKPTGDRFAGCVFEIAMLERQPLGTSFNQKAYWAMNAVINKAYADKWGYAFTLAVPQKQTPRMSKKPANSWYRVPFLHQRLADAQARKEKCGWIVYMDSTSFIRNHDVPLSRFLDGLFKDQPMHPRTGGIFQWDAKNNGLVSDSSFLLQVNGHGEDLVNAWRQSGEADEAMRFEAAEQGTLTELLFPGKVATRSGQALKLFQMAHAKTVTGGKSLRGHFEVLPAEADAHGDQCWGDFIQDTSSLPPGLKRRNSMDQLKRLGLLESFSTALRGLGATQWQPPAWMSTLPHPHRQQAKAKAKVSLAPAPVKVAGLLSESAGAASNASAVPPEVAALAALQDEDLSVEEKEIQQELGEPVF